MYAILMVVCAVGASLCDADHNAYHRWDDGRATFATPEACQAAADALMAMHPPPPTVTGKFVCAKPGDDL